MSDFVSESIQCSVQADDSSLKCLSNVKVMIVLSCKMTRELSCRSSLMRAILRINLIILAQK